jgi:hypothetical protein
VLGVNVWRKLLGVDRATVIESVDFDEEADPWSSTSVPDARRSAVAGSVGVVLPATTGEKGAGTGGHWMSASFSATSRLTPLG